jgi:hypothetical protein
VTAKVCPVCGAAASRELVGGGLKLVVDCEACGKHRVFTQQALLELQTLTPKGRAVLAETLRALPPAVALDVAMIHGLVDAGPELAPKLFARRIAAGKRS